MRLFEFLRKLFAPRGRREWDSAPLKGDGGAASDGEEVDPFDPFPEPVRLEIKDVFDLHSIPPREVRAVVEEYLREAHERGYRRVRIIHGK
ncbi:MAG: Smr/MutS family protein, partial [Pyrinomonadaceae bacterium]